MICSTMSLSVIAFWPFTSNQNQQLASWKLSEVPLLSHVWQQQIHKITEEGNSTYRDAVYKKYYQNVQNAPEILSRSVCFPVRTNASSPDRAVQRHAKTSSGIIFEYGINNIELQSNNPNDGYRLSDVLFDYLSPWFTDVNYQKTECDKILKQKHALKNSSKSSRHGTCLHVCLQNLNSFDLIYKDSSLGFGVVYDTEPIEMQILKTAILYSLAGDKWIIGEGIERTYSEEELHSISPMRNLCVTYVKDLLRNDKYANAPFEGLEKVLPKAAVPVFLRVVDAYFKFFNSMKDLSLELKFDLANNKFSRVH